MHSTARRNLRTAFTGYSKNIKNCELSKKEASLYMQAITAENKLLNYVSSVHLDGKAHEYQMKFSYVVDTLLEFGASEPAAVDTSGYYSDHSPTLASPTSMSPTRMIPTRLSPTLEPRREDPRNDESNLKLQMDQLKLERDQLRLENLKLENKLLDLREQHRQQSDELNQKLKSKDELIEQCESQLKALQEKLKVAQDSGRKSRLHEGEAKEKLTAELKQKEAELGDLKEKLNVAESEKELLEMELQLKADKIVELKSKIEDQREELKASDERATQQNDTIQGLRLDVAAKSFELSKMTKEKLKLDEQKGSATNWPSVEKENLEDSRKSVRELLMVFEPDGAMKKRSKLKSFNKFV